MAVGFFLQGCGVSPVGTLACTASATPYSTTELSNLSVSIQGGNGPYNVTVGGVTQPSTSNFFSYPGILSASANTPIEVQDTSSQASTSCLISATTTQGIGEVYGTTPSPLYCTLTPMGGTSFAPQSTVYFNVTASTSLPLQVVSVSAGTNLNNQPTYNGTASFGLEYFTPGSYQVSVTAQTTTAPAQTCTAMAMITIN